MTVTNGYRFNWPTVCERSFWDIVHKIIRGSVVGILGDYDIAAYILSRSAKSAPSMKSNSFFIKWWLIRLPQGLNFGITVDKRKAWAPYVAARPTRWALRIARLVERANMQSLTQIYVYTLLACARAHTVGKYTIRLSHLPFAAFLTNQRKLRSFNESRKSVV